MRLLFLVPLLACGPKGTDPGDTSGVDDTGDGACQGDGDCPDGQICEGDVCVPGDRNDGMEDAMPLGLDEAFQDEINPAGDEDWYAVTSAGGEFVIGRVESAEDETVLDAVVSIYDGVGTLLAWEDEHPAGRIGGGVDAMAYAYLATAGTYYVKVEDIGHFEGGTGLGGAGADYTIEVSSLTVPGETDSLQDASLDYGSVSADIWYTAQAAFEAAGDGDYTVFDVPEVGMPIYLVVAQRVDGGGATPRLTLYNGDGVVVLEMVDPDAEGTYAMLPATRDDRYVLEVDDADGGTGWGVAFFILRDAWSQNPDEVEPNEDVTTATPLLMEDEQPDVGELWSGYGQGLLDTAGDADVFAVDVPFDDAYLSVAFGAQGYGGLLVGRVEVLDASGAVYATVDSTAGADVDAEDLGPVAAGTWYVRVTAAPDSGATGGQADWYLFGVHASSTPLYAR